MTTDFSSLRSAFAPTGVLRASINLGNPILASKAPENPQGARGVSVDLATEWARRLGVDLKLVVNTTAAASVQTVREEKADIGFFAIDPLRSDGIGFTAPYILIEGSYLVSQSSPLQANEEVDQKGIRIAVGQGSAYDLYLSREIKHAELVRAPTSPTVVDVFVQQMLEVAAGVRQQLEADMMRYSGYRLLPGRFMVIQQAMGLPASRGETARLALATFVEEMKASGFVKDAMRRHGIQGASVAPAAGSS
jgi:polar amino acid transport system substrate-binding protein